MIYYAEGPLVIRAMTEPDARAIAEGERTQGYGAISPAAAACGTGTRYIGLAETAVVTAVWRSVYQKS